MTAIAAIPTDVLQERQQIVMRAKTLQIVDQTTYDEAAYSLNLAGLLEKKITEHYEPMRVTSKAAYDAVLNAKKADLEPVLEVKAILSKGTARYSLEQERIHQAEQDRLDKIAIKEAEAKRKAEIEAAKQAGASRQEIKEIKMAPVEVVSPTIDPTHAQSRLVSKPIENWSAVVMGDEGLMFLVKAVVEGKVHRNLILPNQVALNQLARTFKDKLDVPGVKAVCDHTSRVRSGV